MEKGYIEVIAKFKSSPKDGLAALYEGYGRHLYQFSINNWGLDEDECYDVLYKTLESTGKVIERYEFESESHFKNWLFKIHKNNILQQIRSKKAKEQIVISYDQWVEEIGEYEDEAFDLSAYEPLLDKFRQVNPYNDNQQGSQLFFAMQKALLLVSDIDRDLLLLRMNGYSYDEIAAMLQIENNQLKVKFIRAKAKVEKKTLEILKELSNETNRENITL